MTEARDPVPVKFFCGVLCADESLLPEVGASLSNEFGAIEMESEAFSFNRTEYYKDEAGENILKKFFVFEGTSCPSKLAAMKVRTNEMEKDFAVGSVFSRPVNLDPGYLAMEKMVLASAKNFSHRIYLGQGIYAEVTLIYRGGKFTTLEWTFPDYASGDYDLFFHAVRKSLQKGIE